MKNVAFVDLDKTLIFSKRSIPKPEHGVITCYQRDDEPDRGCWMPQPYLQMLTGLKCEIVIVTARDKADIDKLNLPFEASYTVCNFGSATYKKDTRINSLITQSGLDALKEFYFDCAATEHLSPNKLHKDNGNNVVLHYVLPDEAQAQYYEKIFQDIIEGNTAYSELTTQRNGRHFDVFLKACLKENAVRNLIEKRYQEFFKFGIGDSIIDHGFMSLCDMAITPTNSQLFNNIGEL